MGGSLQYSSKRRSRDFPGQLRCYSALKCECVIKQNSWRGSVGTTRNAFRCAPEIHPKHSRHGDSPGRRERNLVPLPQSFLQQAKFPTLTDKLRELHNWQDTRDEMMKMLYTHMQSHRRRKLLNSLKIQEAKPQKAKLQ